MNIVTHTGEVTNNNDPEKRGRIRAKCPGLVRAGRELPFWIEPRFPYVDASAAGWFFPPKTGVQVEIEIVVGAPGDQTRGEASLVAHNARYRAGLYNSAQQVPEEFKTNYPNRRGIRTPAGNILMFDDLDTDYRLLLQDANGNVLLMTSSGVKITSKDGHYIEWKSTGIDIDGSVKVVRNGDTVTVEPGMVTWMSQVAAVCNGLVPGSVAPPAPPDFGKAVASSTQVGAG